MPHGHVTLSQKKNHALPMFTSPVPYLDQLANVLSECHIILNKIVSVSNALWSRHIITRKNMSYITSPLLRPTGQCTVTV